MYFLLKDSLSFSACLGIILVINPTEINQSANKARIPSWACDCSHSQKNTSFGLCSAFTILKFLIFLLNLCFVCGGRCENGERWWAKEVRTVYTFPSGTISKQHYEAHDHRILAGQWCMRFSETRSKYKKSNIWKLPNTYVKNDDIEGKKTVTHRSFPFQFFLPYQ